MQRKGTVRNINKIEGTGIIEDENAQEISFSLRDAFFGGIKLGYKVVFDIVLTNQGLRAVNIVFMETVPLIL
ncbi:hypothetical protein [Pedobacter miscanthi]|jgi:cold shock CspA family protein|uniref:hypothetical protein n=1 Tax=Pedobacter miscanthi TaxID=2259170 RepID=UPI00292F3DED|nr:hypothetical protein [Pedobacter miscanthi]